MKAKVRRAGTLIYIFKDYSLFVGLESRSSRTDKFILSTAGFRTRLAIWTPGLASSTTAGGLTDTLT